MTARSQRSHGLCLAAMSFPVGYGAQRERGRHGRTGAPNRPRPDDALEGRRGAAERGSSLPPRARPPAAPIAARRHVCHVPHGESAKEYSVRPPHPVARVEAAERAGYKVEWKSGKTLPCRATVPLPAVDWNRRSLRPWHGVWAQSTAGRPWIRHRTWRRARCPHGRRETGASRILEFRS